MSVPLFHVDAFTALPFAGNPAAVCLLDGPRDATWMQSVAAEMNLSETAFVTRADEGFSLRWFTPVTEVELCGHATLASAHALWDSGRLAESEPARFHTQSGLLIVRSVGDWIEMDFPSAPPEQAAPPAGLVESLGAQPVATAKSRWDVLVELEDEASVRALQPDFARLARVETRGTIVTSRAREYDFVSRFFGPAVGINEDPVTGSAHCALAPYWAAKLGKRELVAFQTSKRGGELRLRVQEERVFIAGQAVTVSRGKLVV